MKYVILVLFLGYVYGTPVKPKAEKEDYRLPQHSVEVQTYDLYLKLGNNLFDDNVFDGEVTIEFINKNATRNVKLHANRITIEANALKLEKVNTGSENTEINLENNEFVSDVDTDILTLTADSELEAGATYILSINYKGELRTNEMYGLYKSSYLDENDKETFLATTQFQPTHARKVFPCFDEPIYKAEFTIKIRHPASLNALGNTKGTENPDDDPTFVVTSFNPTPRMSTYLVAFIISDFTCTDSENSETPHRVCSRNETTALRTTAVEAGPPLIVELEKVTGIKYLNSTIGKMDQVAIPDFSAGAMENWGLLTYRETNLLWDPVRSSNSYLQSIKNVISHEIAHMWFGNLVTCHWWSDTFLNEGFARLYQYFATAEIEPNWHLDKQFVTAQIHPMLVLDAQTTATALSHEAYTQSEISGRFGSVSYNKGASIYRMLQHVMGIDNFNQGLNRYLQDRSYSTSTPKDLWEGLSQSVPAGSLPDGTTLDDVMKNWVEEPGFPLLYVHKAGDEVHISQKRFLMTGQHDAQKSWYVPIAYTLSTDVNKFENTNTKVWLEPGQTLTVNVSGADWIILNNKQIGYYRVQYDDTILAEIEAVLKSDLSIIDEINRAHLVDDIYNLARVDTYTYEKMFEFYLYLKNETSYYPWNAAITAFSNMLTRTGNERIRTSISLYILNLINTLYESLPFETAKDDDQIYTFNRVQAVTWACRLGNQDCIDKAVAAFKAYRNDDSKEVDKNLKSSIYCNGLRYSENSTDWDFLWEKYGTTKLASEKVTILSALGCSLDETVLKNYLSKSIDPNSGIKQQDALSVFSSVYTQNPEGVDYALDFLLENHKAVTEYYASMNSLSSLFNGVAGRFTRQEQIDKLQSFIDDNADLSEAVKNAAATAISTAKTNLEYTTEFEKQLNVYFKLNTADSLKIGVTTTIITVFMVFYQMWY